MYSTPIIDAVAHDPALVLANARDMEFQLQAIKESHRIAMASWDEERERALREGHRVARANELLREAFSHVRNMPLADAIGAYLAEFEGEVNPSSPTNTTKAIVESSMARHWRDFPSIEAFQNTVSMIAYEIDRKRLA